MVTKWQPLPIKEGGTDGTTPKSARRALGISEGVSSDNFVSVKDFPFGAVGDGVTDDTAAITAVEALPASVTYIYVPDGTYITTLSSLSKRYYGPGIISLNGTLSGPGSSGAWGFTGRLDITKPGVGLPHIKFWGTTTRYATLRAGSDGTDDGDFYIAQTGDNVWMQSYTDTYRLTLTLAPKGVATVAPANIELFGTDYPADSTNYERLRIHSKGTAESSHEITSEKGGTGTVRSIHVFIGGIANALWIGADANNGIGTVTPRRKFDILDASANQLRLSQADNSVYTDLSMASSGTFSITPTGGAPNIKWGVANVALGGGAAPTVGTIGGSGPAAAGQRNWLRFIESDGTASFIPVWR
jgi:hypothetical protein